MRTFWFRKLSMGGNLLGSPIGAGGRQLLYFMCEVQCQVGRQYLEGGEHLGGALGGRLEVLLCEGRARCRNLRVYGWTRVGELTAMLGQVRLVYKNVELQDGGRTLVDYGIGNGATIFVMEPNTQYHSDKGAITAYHLHQHPDPGVTHLLASTTQALESGPPPKLTQEGTSGVYLLQDCHHKTISLFKPYDEQVHAPNNPRMKQGKLGSESISRGILSGQCATREVAAYLLDSWYGGYHGVPATTYAEFYHPMFGRDSNSAVTLSKIKHGSLQQFIPSEGVIGNYGSSLFTSQQIHRIAILDLRILNCDRNQQNILVQYNLQQQPSYTLIPIDHGLSLPDNLQIYQQSIWWMSVPQSKTPFTQEQLAFIEDIDPVGDAEELAARLGFRQICLRNLRVAEMFLKRAAMTGFTLYEIGSMLYRSEWEDEGTGRGKRSIVESIVMQAENLYLTAMHSIKKQPLLQTQSPLSPSIFTSETQDSDTELQESLIPNNQNRNSNNSSTTLTPSAHTPTAHSPKQILLLKRKISLPQLERKQTSCHQRRHQARKQRQGINGTSRSVWNKYMHEEWNQLFYYYFESMVETMLMERRRAKVKKTGSQGLERLKGSV